MEPESKIKWLPTLYAFDNKRVLRSYRIGHSKDGVAHTQCSIVRKSNGEPGAVQNKKRQIDANARSETKLIAATKYCQQEWEKKQRIGRYRQADKPPKDSEYAKWMSSDERKWPAVCLDWEKAKDKDRHCSESNPWLCQPKFDGDRIMAWLRDGKVMLFSRNCMEKKFLDAIRQECKIVFKALRELGITDVGLDGEVFLPDLQAHQNSRSRTGRSVNKHEDEDSLVYVIFDIMDYTRTFEERSAVIEQIQPIQSKLEHIQLCHVDRIESDEGVVSYVQICNDNGFVEGIVLRRPDIMYPTNKSQKKRTMLKLKNFEEEEFEVIGFKEAKGTREGCAVWECRDLEDESIVFSCSYAVPEEQQREAFRNGKSYIGNQLTVKYLSKTEEGKPFHPVGLRFRDEGDLPDNSADLSSSASELLD